MHTLSVVIVTKNEEKEIRDCLESVAWASEIVVVDSHSEDATVRICREYTDKVHVRDWPGYASQKNFGIDQATGDWVLILDADERVSPELREEIRTVLGSSPVFSAYRIPFKNFLGRHWLAHGGLHPDYHARLFRRSAARYGKREIHESLKIDGKIGRLQGSILHMTYDDIADYVHKVNLYTTLEADHLAAAGRKYRWWHLLKPVPRFFKLYIRKQGFRDGIPGFISAALLSLYSFLICVKVMERRGL